MDNSYRIESYTAQVGAASTEALLEMLPKYDAPQVRRGVQFVHGAGSGATYCLDAYGNQGALTNAIVSAGYPAVSGENGGPQTWGNSLSVARVGENLRNLSGLRNSDSSGYALISGSMGGLVSLNYAAQAKVKPRAIVSVIPVISPEDIRANNRGGYAGLVNAAYGGAYNEATMGAYFNPHTMRNADKLKGIPMLLIYGTTDAVCIPSLTEAFAAADPTYRTLVPVAFGHEENAYKAVNIPQVIDFLNAHML